MNLSEDLLQYFSDPSVLKQCVLAYPLFITKDYCNKIHCDNDRSKYTMFVSSNPTMDTTGGYLVMLEYGIKIPTLDGDIFFLRGQDMHSTSYRPPLRELVYVVGVALNEKLGGAYTFVNESV